MRPVAGSYVPCPDQGPNPQPTERPGQGFAFFFLMKLERKIKVTIRYHSHGFWGRHTTDPQPAHRAPRLVPTGGADTSGASEPRAGGASAPGVLGVCRGSLPLGLPEAAPAAGQAALREFRSPTRARADQEFTQGQLEGGLNHHIIILVGLSKQMLWEWPRATPSLKAPAHLLRPQHQERVWQVPDLPPAAGPQARLPAALLPRLGLPQLPAGTTLQEQEQEQEGAEE